MDSSALSIMKPAKFLMAMLASASLAGCMVGPNYHRPAVQTPPAYRGPAGQPQPQAQAASYADLPWWQVFQDPKLQELIRIALKQNYDLQLAAERIVAARAELAITRSSLFPQVQGNGNFSGGKENTFQTKYNFLTLTADAAFQLDLFGRLRRATEAARAQLLATEAAKQTVILTLVSDVAADYFTLLELDLELQITHDTVTTQIDSVKLTNLRLAHGVATKLDVLQAQQVLDTANAQIPDLERQIAQEEDAISILLGNYPQDVTRGLPLVEQNLPPEVPPGLPSSILERRPDIREAEQNLIAANAEIGVAKAEFFPQISLTGSGGGSFGRSSTFSSLMSSQVGIWSYGAQVSQPIFTGGALRGNLRLAESQHQQALIALPANHSACVRRRLRCVDRLSEAPSGTRSHGEYRRGPAGVCALVHHALQGGHDDLSRSIGRAAVTLLRRVDPCGGARQRVPEPGATLSSSGRRLAAVGAGFAFSIDIRSDLIQQ